jgi:hypothetical protein
LVLIRAAEEAAGEVGQSAKRLPQALKRGHIFSELLARVELVPFPVLSTISFSATSEK